MRARDNVISLVVIDDDEGILALIQDGLQVPGLELFTTDNPKKGLELVRRTAPAMVLLDLVMPGVNGMELLQSILDIAPTADVILMTGNYSTESAIEAIRCGAADYLPKPVPLGKLREKISGLLQDVQRQYRAEELEEELLETCEFQGMVGRGAGMLEVFARVRRVAPHFRTVLITGPTGSGKEGTARLLHRLSPAATGPFVVCNCSAIVETLFESELFGHTKGAFTGAVQDRVGMFEYASGGCLFLDEIGDMPLSTQAKLLRVLQDHEVRRVGATTARKVDVCVIAATHRNLASMVRERSFREDLYYRLSAVEIALPPLCDRKEDLPLLIRHFIERFSAEYKRPVRRLTRRAETLLAEHSWPGNVRELENAISHACMMGDGSYLDVSDFPAAIADARCRSAQNEADEDWQITIDDLQVRHAWNVIERVAGNKARAAEILGISRARLYRLLQRGGRGLQPEQSMSGRLSDEPFRNSFSTADTAIRNRRH